MMVDSLILLGVKHEKTFYKNNMFENEIYNLTFSKLPTILNYSDDSTLLHGRDCLNDR